MVEALAHRVRPVFLSLLAVGLSGCALFTDPAGDEQAPCPTAKLPENRQPFDFVARKSLQKLVERNANSDKGDTDKNRFVRLGEQGTPLSQQQAKYDSAAWARDDSKVPWACVKDNRTGLSWEVKRNDLSLQDRHWTYTWYDASLTDGREYAGQANGGKCLGGSGCDTQAYVDAVNARGLCGHDDWRLPQAFELATLLDRRIDCPGSCIDQRYFPNTVKGGYWTSSPFDEFICYAWAVDFELGDTTGAHKNTPLHVRLVRGNWLKSPALEKHGDVP